MALLWFRVDTNFYTHDKFLELIENGQKGKAAGLVYIASLAYAAGHGTDGFIRTAALPFIHATKADAIMLATARLWDVVEGGYQIRNWGERQLVAATHEAITKARSDAGKKGAEARWSNV